MIDRRAEKRESEKNKHIITIICVLLAATVAVAIMSWQAMGDLNDVYSDLNKVQYISSSTQRLVSLGQQNQYTEKDIFLVGDNTIKSLEQGGEENISLLGDATYILLANKVIESWRQIEEILLEASKSGDPVDTLNLTLARDAHYNSMTDLSSSIMTYSADLNDQIAQYQIIVLALAFSIAMVMINNLLQTHTELKQSKLLAETAQIDTSTGLYNRSRCQELFKSNQNAMGQKQPAIMVLDLNDLKKTNDTLGHRVGDELIQSFANALKQACNVHVVQPFVGRYGGDEFIVYYDDIAGEEDINFFVKELTYITKEFNDKESRFQISYALGYAYVDKNSGEGLTVRQLFDKADEAMYVNKVALKTERATKENELKEGV